MLVVRLHDFHSNHMEVSNNETEAEILRRSKSDAYYLESVRAFEKVFGMDKLEKVIAETQAKHQTLLADPTKNQFIFDNDDLEKQVKALDEFTTRHKTITDRINETYRIGAKMINYLEKQIILDYHLRGEQDLFEQEYEHLKQKAEKMLGYPTYFALSSLTGTPVTEDNQPELYQKLMEIQQKITTGLDVTLAEHNVKLGQYEDSVKPTMIALDEDKVAHSHAEEEAEVMKDDAKAKVQTMSASEGAKLASAINQADVKQQNASKKTVEGSLDANAAKDDTKKTMKDQA